MIWKVQKWIDEVEDEKGHAGNVKQGGDDHGR